MKQICKVEMVKLPPVIMPYIGITHANDYWWFSIKMNFFGSFVSKTYKSKVGCRRAVERFAKTFNIILKWKE
jgi:hypothetical protein